MVTGIMEKVTIQDFHPQVERDVRELQPEEGFEVGVVGSSEKGAPPEVVSKDFILNLLSLAIGKPFFLEGNLGKNVDVKV